MWVGGWVGESFAGFGQGPKPQTRAVLKQRDLFSFSLRTAL